MNDEDRAEWVETTLEGFYLDWQRQRLIHGTGLRRYVREHRSEIDAVIRAMPGTEALFRNNREE